MNILATAERGGNAIDLAIIVAYMVAILGVGIFAARKSGRTSTEYFLAGRSLRWPVIGLALFATNISTVHLVGLAADGYRLGLVIGNFEWLAAFCLVLLGLVFAPFYFKSGISTLPDYLEKRFSGGSRTVLAFMAVVGALFIHIGMSLYAGSAILESFFGINVMASILIISAVTAIYTVVGGLKAVVVTESIQTVLLLFGAVAVTVFAMTALSDRGINSYAQLKEAIDQQERADREEMVAAVGEVVTVLESGANPDDANGDADTLREAVDRLKATATLNGVLATLGNAGLESEANVLAEIATLDDPSGEAAAGARVELVQHLENGFAFADAAAALTPVVAQYQTEASSFQTAADSGESKSSRTSMLHPSGGLSWFAVLLGYPILGIWYWCADQTIVQRVLGARTQRDAQLGPIFAGFIKILPVFIMVWPGVFAYVLYREEIGHEYNAALPVLIDQLIPVGLKGIIAAGLLAALMSTIAGALNSTATLVSLDIVKKLRPQTSDASLVRTGRITACVVMLLAMLWSTQGGRFESIFTGMNAMIACLASNCQNLCSSVMIRRRVFL
ncbi:MAG: hypothetical protein WD294_03845, partial [Phycisphaeraceae bacterium]